MLNPYVLLAIVGIWLATLAGAGVAGWHERAVRVPAELAAQSHSDSQECEKAQQLTKGANDVLQKNRNDIAAQLASYKLLRPTACLRVAGSSQLPGSGPGHAEGDGNGLNTNWLLDYAATCEQYRTEVTECTMFLTQERQLMKEPQ